VQGREFFATLEPVFVNGAFIITQEMAGHAVHDHQAIAAFFEVLFVEGPARLVKMPRKPVRFIVRDQYHQALAAVAAVNAADLRRNTVVELRNHAVYLPAVMLLHKNAETVVFCGMVSRKSGDPGQVGFNMWFFRFDFSKLTFRRLIANEIQVFNKFIHILDGFVEK
jgi:hypothetical protein